METSLMNEIGWDYVSVDDIFRAIQPKVDKIFDIPKKQLLEKGNLLDRVLFELNFKSSSENIAWLFHQFNNNIKKLRTRLLNEKGGLSKPNRSRDSLAELDCSGVTNVMNSIHNKSTEDGEGKLSWNVITVDKLLSAMIPVRDQIVRTNLTIASYRGPHNDLTTGQVYDTVLDRLNFPKLPMNKIWIYNQLRRDAYGLRKLLIESEVSSNKKSPPDTARPSLSLVKNRTPKQKKISISEDFPFKLSTGSEDILKSINKSMDRNRSDLLNSSEVTLGKNISWDSISVEEIATAILPLAEKIFDASGSPVKFRGNYDYKKSGGLFDQVLERLNFSKTTPNKVWLSTQLSNDINNLRSYFTTAEDIPAASSPTKKTPKRKRNSVTNSSTPIDISSKLPPLSTTIDADVNTPISSSTKRFQRIESNSVMETSANKVSINLDEVLTPATIDTSTSAKIPKKRGRKSKTHKDNPASEETPDLHVEVESSILEETKSEVKHNDTAELHIPFDEYLKQRKLDLKSSEKKINWKTVSVSDLVTAMLPMKYQIFNRKGRYILDDEHSDDVFNRLLDNLNFPRIDGNRTWLKGHIRNHCKLFRPHLQLGSKDSNGPQVGKRLRDRTSLSLGAATSNTLPPPEVEKRVPRIYIKIAPKIPSSETKVEPALEVVKPLRDRTSPEHSSLVSDVVEQEKTPQAPAETISEPIPQQQTETSAADVSMTTINPKFTKIELGTMFWAKVGSHPWWPCMVYYSPDNKTYDRTLGAGRGYSHYHVQFFGPLVERCWVTLKQIIPFEGKEAFDKFVEDTISKTVNKKQVEQRFSVLPRRKVLWDASWREAEEALPLSLSERVFTYGRTYATKGDFAATVDSESESDSELESEKEESSIIIEKPKRGRPRKIKDSPDVTKVGQKRRRTSSNSSGRTEAMSVDLEKSLMSPPLKKRKKELKEKKVKAVSIVYEFQRIRYSTAVDKKKQLVCHICARPESGDPTDGSEPVLACAGKCINAFHASCLNALYPDDKTLYAPSPPSPPAVNMETSIVETATNVISETGEDDNVIPSKLEKVDADVDDYSAQPTVVTASGDCVTEPLSVKVDETTALVKSDPVVSKDFDTLAEEAVNSNPVTMHKCADCRENIRRCQVCHEECSQDPTTLTVQRCNVGLCRRVYHTQCLVDTELTQFCNQMGNNLLTCPAHHCHICSLEHPSVTGAKKNVLRCLRCPVVYHSGEACIPVGSVVLSNAFILCPRHVNYPQQEEPPSVTKKGRPSLKVSASSSSLVSVATATGTPHTPPLSKRTSQLWNVPSTNSVINVTWCFICSKGGHLICCDRCPASFHPKCHELDEVPDVFHCRNCSVGRFPRYGEFLWGKVGHYRWWPCETIHPRHVPPLTMALPHRTGQFVVHFFGTDEYQWVSFGRVFPFEAGDELEKRQHNKQRAAVDGGDEAEPTEGLSALEKAYKLGLCLAGVGMQKRLQRLSSIGASKAVATKSYRPIKTNFPIGNVRLNRTPLDLSEVSQCDCRPNDSHSNDPCGPTSDCLNRELFFECHPNVCRHGSQCRNQRFTLRQYPAQSIFKTEGRGWGLKADADIKKGDFVNEYVGDLIDEEEAERRLVWAHENNIHNFYMMKLDGQRIIDAGPKGNLSRFMNHSCSPNLYAQKWQVASDSRVGLFALRDLVAGDELNFNYNLMSVGQEKLACKCGAPNCSGLLGVPPTKVTSMTPPDSLVPGDSSSAASTSSATSAGTEPPPTTLAPSKASSSISIGRKRKSQSSAQSQVVTAGDSVTSTLLDNGKKNKDVYDSDCFRCGEPGELILCDKPECTKGYHLICLGLKKLPYGKWFCPWHHCEICGRPSEEMCSECPTSYCRQHSQNNIYTLPDQKKLCLAHEDLLTAVAISASTS